MKKRDIPKKLWALTKLYFLCKKWHYYATHTKDPTKLEIIKLTYNASYKLYNQIKPKWYPTLPPLPENQMEA